MEILKYIFVLLVLIGINLALGLYSKLGIEQVKYSWKIFRIGLLKCAIIFVTFVVLQYAVMVVDLSAVGVDPITIINTAILLYFTKVIIKLKDVLGISSTIGKVE